MTLKYIWRSFQPRLSFPRPFQQSLACSRIARSPSNSWASCTLWILSTTYYELLNVTHATRARFRSVETFIQFFAVCGPKFIELSAVFRSRASCFVQEIIAIKLRSCPKFGANFDIFGPPFFEGREGPPKFLIQFYKFGSPSNMFQNLVTIDWVTSNISRWKLRRKKKINDSGETESPRISIAHSWR